MTYANVGNFMGLTLNSGNTIKSVPPKNLGKLLGFTSASPERKSSIPVSAEQLLAMSTDMLRKNSKPDEKVKQNNFEIKDELPEESELENLEQAIIKV